MYKLYNRAYRDYVRSESVLQQLNLIVLAAAIGTFMFTAIGGVAFTGYASALGAGEFAFGVITAMPILAGLVQIYVSHLAVKTGKYKRMFIAGGVCQRLFWTFAAFIPYLFPVEESRLWSLIVIVTLAAMSGSFVAISHTTLMGSVIPIDIRGRFVAARQRVCTAASLLFGFGIAFVLDNIPGFLGYTIVFAVGGIAGIIDILLYFKIDFSGIPDRPEGFSLKQGMRDCFTVPKVRNYLVFWTLWCFVINISGPFFNKYAIDVLSLSYISIIIFGQIAAQTMAFLVIQRWGVFLDRYGSVPMMLISSVSATVIMTVWLFATPGSIWPMFVFNILGGMFWCANDACMVNMQLTHTPSKGRPAALAVYAVFTSLSTAAALIVGGALLEAFSPIMAGLKLTLFGTPFDHYKLVFCIAIVLRYIVIFGFLPRVWNEKDIHFREAYKKLVADFKTRIKYGLTTLRILKK